MFPALVLTAGFGTRLDPLTRLVAKPAVPLGDRALIERVLGWLSGQGVREAVLNLHHRPETITGIVGDGAHLGVRVRYSWETPLLGSAGGPRHALPLLDADTFCIVNGDTLCDVDLSALAAAHQASGAAVTLAVVPNPAPDRYNGLRLDADDRVIGVVPKGHTEPTWHFTGVQVAQAAVFAALPDGVPAESVHGVYRALMGSSGGLRAHRVASAFVDVGTPRDYLAAALSLAGDHVISPHALVAPGARLTHSVAWAGAAIGAHAALEDCIVTGVSVPPGFAARGCLLVPASVCRSGDRARVTGDLACFTLDRDDAG